MNTQQELLTALQGLMNYVGGWDETPDHPCGIARAAIQKATADTANARLIASAPDLLETLRELITQIYEDVPDEIVSDHFLDALAAAEAAIAKATGDAQ